MGKNTRFFTHSRLAYYRAMSAMDWDVHWATEFNPAIYPDHSVGLGMLSFIRRALHENMREGGRVLEAGCGMGHIVNELRMQGFNCEGVDSAALTIAKIREMKPSLPVRVGNLLCLDVPDAFYDAYISLGVVEHLEEGPEPFLVEAHRVLAQNGIAIFTVPFCNTIRRIKAQLGVFHTPPASGEYFYQYAFTCEEFAEIAQENGFRVLWATYYDPWKGLKDELWPCAWLNSKPDRAGKCRAWADKQTWLYPHAAHMLGLVCVKR